MLADGRHLLLGEDEKVAGRPPPSRPFPSLRGLAHGAADCVFCKIARGEIPSARVLETDDAIAFLDIAPVNLGISSWCRSAITRTSWN
ncbi:MAG: hypothetical protein U0800_08665 [Isosphaeraceae bacterium]